MLRTLAVLVLCSLMAGCLTSDDGAPSVGDLPAEKAPEEGVAESLESTANTTEPHLIETVQVHWNGTMGTRFLLCEYETTGACLAHDVAAGESDLLIDRAGSILEAVELTMTWDAVTPATANLVLDTMVMGYCDACNSTMLDNAEGPSPLSISMEGIDIRLGNDDVFHAYTYNPTLLKHQPPIVTYSNLDQAFSVTGTLLFRVPAAAQD